VNESTSIKFVITEDEFSDLKKQLHYWDVGGIEGLWNKVSVRFNDAQERINDKFYKSEQYQRYLARSKAFHEKGLEKILQGYSLAEKAEKRAVQQVI